ncbi:hypothetical protein [Kaistella pullorum]|uniref:YcxB-like protein domain-containing protein n=1 Tax=Kaistella pullorum TaxID=2763074 RepID=A0ABR8WR04_9FLAO|nr:hypothetical protein [Kaistella pullorum]MBD8019131.1 hypothetical protein [Kaistella pullorum]
MIKKEIDNIKRSKKHSFTLWNFIERYLLVIFPFAISVVSLSAIKSGVINNNIELQTIGWITFIASFTLIFILSIKLYNNQFFQSYKIQNLTIENIENSLKKSGFDDFEYNKIGFFEVSTGITWFSWGGTLTLIQTENELLLNYRTKGLNGVILPFTSPIIKKKIKKFIQELQSR